MIITTTPNVEGRAIARYHGIVTGETILGANIFRDIVGGWPTAREQEPGRGCEAVRREMKARAVALGSVAFVRGDLDYEVINSMSVVSFADAAVAVER